MKYLTLTILVWFLSAEAMAGGKTNIGQFQVRETQGSQAASSLFEVATTTKGSVACPKMTTVQRDAISSPTEGLCVWNTSTNRRNSYNGSSWTVDANTSDTGTPARNYLLNSDHFLYQSGTSDVTVANGATAYHSDQWYGKNALGTDGVLTLSRITSSLPDGAAAAMQVKITTAPTASQANGTEAYQSLRTTTSIELMNSTVTACAYVKALGNVNQAGVQLYYKTTQGKVDTAQGSEGTASVSTGAWTQVCAAGVSSGTSVTTSGSYGIRIRITGVSSGNTYDLNNGFIFTQASLTKSSSAPTWSRAFQDASTEIEALRAFYQKSWALGTAPATVTDTGRRIYARGAGTALGSAWLSPAMVSAPTVTVYSPVTGASGTVRNYNTGTEIGTSVGTEISEVGFNVSPGTAGTAGDAFGFHFVANARF